MDDLQYLNTQLSTNRSPADSEAQIRNLLSSLSSLESQVDNANLDDATLDTLLIRLGDADHAA